jgi:hypothetical protein
MQGFKEFFGLGASKKSGRRVTKDEDTPDDRSESRVSPHRQYGWNAKELSDSLWGKAMKVKLWTGRIITGLTVLFLLFDGVTKLMQVSQVKAGMATLGYPPSLTVPIGILVLVCTAFYVVPATSVLGAVLLTGFLGGATASMVRAHAPGHPYLFPVVFGGFVWLGLYLRDPRIGQFLPMRTR